MAARPLVTLDRIKQDPAADRIEDASLRTLISGASTLIEQHCNRTFYLQRVEEGFNGNEDQKLFLSCTPLDSIEAVKFVDYDRVTYTYTSGVLLWDNQTGEIQLSSLADYTTFPRGFQNVEIDYYGGYETIPEDLQEACCQVALHLGSLGSTSNDLALGAETPGDYSHGYRSVANAYGPIPPAVRQMLASYLSPWGGSRE